MITNAACYRNSYSIDKTGNTTCKSAMYRSQIKSKRNKPGLKASPDIIIVNIMTIRLTHDQGIKPLIMARCWDMCGALKVTFYI